MRNMTGGGHNLFVFPAYHRALGRARLREEFPDEPFIEVPLEQLTLEFKDYLRRFQRYRRAVFFTYDLKTAPRIALWSAFLSWIGRSCVVLDASGGKRTGSLGSVLTRDIPQLAGETVQLPFLLWKVARDIARIQTKKKARLAGSVSIAYLRTDHWFGITAGGSVTHVAGVANAFRNLGIPLFLVSSDKLELIDKAIPLLVIEPRPALQNLQGGAEMAYNRRLIARCSDIFAERRPALLYQRYSPYNYTGAYLATVFQLPFVLEYNGSEVWMAKHWGTPMRFSKWAAEIEIANLRAADAVVVVSQALKDELVARGIASEKILVNPNGVDTCRFDPDIIRDESQRLRKTLGLEKKVVVGFVATFGRWHGAEILARTVRPIIEKEPRAHFLFIGDGPTAAATRDIINADRLTQAAATFTGIIPQKDGPLYLGACDLFVCPQTPNPDGSPFFGSPTKLFEYMAMGSGIVASRLDQIGEVLKHRTTGLLVTPGSVDELANGILELVANADERKRLGSNARQEVLARYTWTAHTQRILDHIRNVLT